MHFNVTFYDLVICDLKLYHIVFIVFFSYLDIFIKLINL